MHRLQAWLQLVGRVPLCNKCADRAPKMGGFVFVLCYRCSGLVLGLCIGCAMRAWMPANAWTNLPLILACLALLPIDVLAQQLPRYRSSNVRRFVSGVLFSVALCDL